MKHLFYGKLDPWMLLLFREERGRYNLLEILFTIAVIFAEFNLERNVCN